MAFPILFYPFSFTKRSATAGTKIDVIVPPKNNKRAWIGKILYTTGANAHGITILHPLNKTTVAAPTSSQTANTSGQAVIKLAADPGVYTNTATSNNLIAANDYLIIRRPDGGVFAGVVSSASTQADGTVLVTLTANLPTNGVATGAQVWFMGVAGDTNPRTGVVHETFSNTTTSTTAQSILSNYAGVGVSSLGLGEPILVQSTNVTAAGTFEEVSGGYLDA